MRVARSSPRSLSLAPPRPVAFLSRRRAPASVAFFAPPPRSLSLRPRLGRFLCAPASVAFSRAPAPPPRSLSLRPRRGRFLCAPAAVAFFAPPPRSLSSFFSRRRAPASVAFFAPPPRSLASHGVRRHPAVTCCSPRALSAACTHKLSMLRRRRPVSARPSLAAPPEPSRLRALTSSRCCGGVARCPPRRRLLLPPSPLGCVRSQALDVAAASHGVRRHPAVTCCSPRALSAACAHKLSMLRRRRPVSARPSLAAPPEPSRLRALTSSRFCGGVERSVADSPAVTCCSSRALSAACAHRLLFSRRRRPVSVLAARLRALLLEWRHRPLCLTPPSPLVATFIIKKLRTSADTSARARCIGQTTERGGERRTTEGHVS
jgi:hypothetical protein